MQAAAERGAFGAPSVKYRERVHSDYTFSARGASAGPLLHSLLSLGATEIGLRGRKGSKKGFSHEPFQVPPPNEVGAD